MPLHRCYREDKNIRLSRAAAAVVEGLEDRQLLSSLVWTDKADYPPGSLALISGSGFAAGETVQLQLEHLPGTPVGANHVATAPWTVQTDAAGLFSSSWPVTDPDALNATYILTASGLGDGLWAQTLFTDKAEIASGDGHMALATNPSPMTPGSSGNVLTFTFTFDPGNSGHVFKNGSQATLFIPAGWTQPQATSASTAGYVSVAASGGTATLNSISGSAAAGWTIAIDFSANKNDGFTLTYGGSAGVTAPFTGSYTFTTTTASPGDAAAVLHDGSSPAVSFLKTAAISTAAASGSYGGTLALAATLTSGGAALTGKSIVFTLNGISVGSAVTDSKGVATLDSASLLGINAGSHAAGVAASFAADAVYGPAAGSASLTVQQALLTVSAAATSKVYDGTPAAVVSLSDNHLAGDDLTLGYSSALFADKNVGDGKTVTVSDLAITGGASAGNYVLASDTATTTASITPVSLAASVTAAAKTYDGTTAATLTGRTLAGVIGNDQVSLTGGSATFADKNVGAGKLVTVAGMALTGADSGNYTLAVNSASTTADITAATLHVTATGINKIYDATTAATVSLSDDRITNDTLTLSYAAATFADKNAGDDKPVNVSGITISGADAGNYLLASTTASTTADIKAQALSLVVVATGIDKVYDGTTSASVSLSDNRVAGDDFTLSYAKATFADENVGDKTITVDGVTLAGPDAANYSLASDTVLATASITPAALIVTASGLNKVYDGTTTATVGLSTNCLADDAVKAIYTSATFADRNAGEDKTVAVSGITLTGADAGNYTLSSDTASTTASIACATLTPSVKVQNKVCDGTTRATIASAGLLGVIGKDEVRLACGPAAFANSQAATAKTVTIKGLHLAGADASNYVLASTTARASANISKKPQAKPAPQPTPLGHPSTNTKPRFLVLPGIGNARQLLQAIWRRG